MRIFTWCDPNYFHFMNALIRSIRYHGNENHITALLMDFNPEQKDKVKDIFKNDSKMQFIWDNGQSFHNISIKDHREYYRNCRPRYFIDQLQDSPSGKLCTFGANGIVWTDLKFIENILDKKDFVFLERQKPNRFSNHPEKIGSMEELHEFMSDTGLTFPEIFPTSTSKIVLLGTHAMRRNEYSLAVLNKWKDLVENPKDLNAEYSDMNLFVQAYIETQDKIGWKLKKETGLGTPRAENPFCDTNFNTDKIWFAKGPSKFHNKKYLKAVEFFSNYEYSI